MPVRMENSASSRGGVFASKAEERRDASEELFCWARSQIMGHTQGIECRAWVWAYWIEQATDNTNISWVLRRQVFSGRIGP